MELYLQMGHGMQSMSKELISQWGAGHIIISPVNIKQQSLEKYTKEISALNGKLYFDPQIFYPHDANTKLKEYDYWPQGSLSDTSTLSLIHQELLELNNKIETEAIILPSYKMDETTFYKVLKQLSDGASFFRAKTQKKLFATLCIASETIRNQEFIENILDTVTKLDVDGFYVIAQPSNGEYINTDTLWEMGFLKLVACLKLSQKKVIVGYSSHQTLVTSILKVDGIASGTYMNTRSFSPEKFQSYSDDDTKRKSTWYYLPEAMNEYKATILDIAKQRGFLGEFAPQGDLKNEYSAMLFSGAMPSSTSYKERESFMHYLTCLKKQCDTLTQKSYQDTFNAYDFMLNIAERKIKTLKTKGIRGQNRDFEPGIEANRIAMFAINEDYGFKLRMEWENL